MIAYFSATGNSRYVAQEMARLLDDETVDLMKRMHDDDRSPLRSDKPFVLCIPVYADGIPMALYRYLERIGLEGSRIVYAVFTMGAYSGIAGRQAAGLFHAKGMDYRGWTEIKMPNNYIVGPIPAEEPQSIKEKILAAPSQVAAFADVIAREGTFEPRKVHPVEYYPSLWFVLAWDKIYYSTKPFEVGATCISCGLCERTCPVNAIQMVDGKPVWQISRCMHCMACLQRCPKHAIEYGKGSRGKQRYLFDKYKDLLTGKKDA